MSFDRTMRGAIAALDASGAPTRVVVFQFNPDTLTRTLTARTMGQTADRSEVLRLKGPPEESIKLDVELDAADQPDTSGSGVAAALAALETLLYPRSSRVLENEALLRAGNLEIVPPEAPLALLVWGPRRVLPVRVASFTITEEAFDGALMPIRVRVGLDLRVLSYFDLGLSSAGGAIFMAHQVAKEQLARVSGSAAAADLHLNIPTGG